MSDADVRAVAAAEPPPVAENVVRVPPASQTANDVVQAERALTEIRARQADDQLHAEQERAAELTRWNYDDQVDRGDGDELDLDDVAEDSANPVLEW